MDSATIGFNALSHYVADRARLLRDVGSIGGLGALVMDDPTLAHQVRSTLGSNSLVVHRRYQPDDHELYKRYTPSAWLDSIAPTALGGLLIQCHNEPRIEAHSVDAFVNWNVEVLRLAHQRGIRLAVGTFGVGNPHESLVESGKFDRLLMALGKSDALMLHEYFQDRPTAPSEYGWLCGRVEYWLERMKALGCQCRTVIIGEYGRDIGGGVNDGWRGTGWSAEEYAKRFIEGMERIYKPLAAQYDVDISVNMFCAGGGAGGRWQSFNVEQVEAIYKAMEAWNQAQAVAPPHVWGDVQKGTITRTNATYANVRAEPSLNSAVVGSVKAGTRLTYHPNAKPSTTDSYTWLKLDAPMIGYLASEVVTITPDAEAETGKKLLDVPYVSQTDANANLRNNDCGIACALMMRRFIEQRAGLRYAPFVTVNRLISATPLQGSDKVLLLIDIENTLDGLGVNAAIKTSLTVEAIRAEIASNRPVLALYCAC